MAPNPTPTVSSNKLYILEDLGSGQYKIASVQNLNITIEDATDGSGDDLSTLGDIANDSLTVTIGTAQYGKYISKTANAGEFVFADYSSGRYLFSSNTYSANDTISGVSGTYAVCYGEGTRIRTVAGDVAVECLTVGSLVVTASGAHRPVRWLGHRRTVCAGRADLLPIRIAQHAFGEGRPARDLFVSPAHAVCVDILGEVLIPACRLVNGTTITQGEVETVTYWHVELDSHDILLAEGLPAESYLDCGNRRFFANAPVTDLAAVPDVRPDGPLPFCRPFHEEGPVVELVRARLEARAKALGWHLVEEAFAGLHIVADGRAIHPDREGLTARFVLPAEARDVRLVSAVSVPAHVVPGSSDDRRLGVSLAALVLDDGSTAARTIALDDPRLSEGFHSVDGTGAGSWRWTNGEAVLPASLWDGCRDSLTLTVALAGAALPRWVRPNARAGALEQAALRRA